MAVFSLTADERVRKFFFEKLGLTKFSEWRKLVMGFFKQRAYFSKSVSYSNGGTFAFLFLPPLFCWDVN